MKNEVRIKKRISGVFAIYYGMGSMIAAIATVVKLIVTLFKIWSGKADLDWAGLIALSVFAGIAIFIGYLL